MPCLRKGSAQGGYGGPRGVDFEIRGVDLHFKGDQKEVGANREKTNIVREFPISIVRSNHGNNEPSGGIFARIQATKSRAISEIARHSMARGFSTDACSAA